MNVHKDTLGNVFASNFQDVQYCLGYHGGYSVLWKMSSALGDIITSKYRTSCSRRSKYLAPIIAGLSSEYSYCKLFSPFLVWKYIQGWVQTCFLRLRSHTTSSIWGIFLNVFKVIILQCCHHKEVGSPHSSGILLSCYMIMVYFTGSGYCYFLSVYK